MKHTFSSRYEAALLAHLKADSPASPLDAGELGALSLAAGLRTLQLAKLHEQTLITKVLPGCNPGKRRALIKKAGGFFAETIALFQKGRRDGKADDHRQKTVEMLSERTVELAASNIALQLEIDQRKAVEEALRKSERHYSHLLGESDRLQQQLRLLSRQILSAQEEERKEISRELHDVIAQTLTGINVRLAALAKEAATNTKGLDRNIVKTQRLVEQSVEIVHRFARDLRPAVLDDLGLIPALHSFLKNFTTRTGIRTRLTAFAGVEDLDATRRTSLFRVAQEALTNVARHARATRVDVNIHKLAKGIGMKIHDDGKSFPVEKLLHPKGNQHLGLLGMRERVEMVGGIFCVESAPGKGTTVQVEIPFAKVPVAKLKNSGKTTLQCPTTK